MSSQDGELNILIPGRKIYAIFGMRWGRQVVSLSAYKSYSEIET